MKQSLGLTLIGFLTALPLMAEGPKWATILDGHSESVDSVAWKPDGKLLASGSGDGTIRIWSVDDSRCVTTLVADIDFELWHVSCVAWSPDGKTLASGSYDNSVRLWNAATGRNLTTVVGHTDWVRFVTWSPDGKVLAFLGGGTVKLWDVGTGKNVATIQKNREWINSVAWSPDGEHLASGDADGIVKIRDVMSSNRIIASLDGESGLNVLAIEYSPDGKMLASGDGCTIKIWDTVSHKSIHTLRGHSSELVTYAHGNFAGQYIPAITSVAFSPDGKTLASGSQDKTIILWHVASGKRTTTLQGHSGAVNSVAWSPDGKILASAGDDKTIKLWNVADRARPEQDSTP